MDAKTQTIEQSQTYARGCIPFEPISEFFQIPNPLIHSGNSNAAVVVVGNESQIQLQAIRISLVHLKRNFTSLSSSCTQTETNGFVLCIGSKDQTQTKESNDSDFFHSFTFFG